MILRNHTPFVPMVFAGMDVRDRMFGVLVLRGTFRIGPRRALELDEQQEPLVVSDTFHGEASNSSLHLESDLAPHKPRADVHIHAVAHARGGWEEPSWMVRARVGVLDKSLRVYGPRRWIREGASYRLTEPEACKEVPIRYEHAFGGVWTGPWSEPDVLQENPVGVGWVPEGQSPSEPEWPAPRIESPDDPIVELGKPHRPEGLGPIFRAWLPRRAHAGTYDDTWRKERWPRMPLDFDFRFFNSAHPDLVYPGYLLGDEEVELEGLSPDGDLRFSLPGCRAAAVVESEGGASDSGPMFLDTLVIDVPAGRAHLTWRATIPSVERIRAIEVHTDLHERRGS